MLNEVLRLGNGFANAGAIPKIIKRAGERAIRLYLDARAASKPSNARWVFEQATFRTHTHFTAALAAKVKQMEAQLEFEWSDFCTYWLRYMAMTHATLRWVSRFRLRRARAMESVESNYYTRLMDQHNAYWAASSRAPLSAVDLSIAEQRQQRREYRREQYDKVKQEARPCTHLQAITPRRAYPRPARQNAHCLSAPHVRQKADEEYLHAWLKFDIWDARGRPDAEAWEPVWQSLWGRWNAAGRPGEVCQQI